MLIMMAFFELSFEEEETSIAMNNIEALAQQEIDILKLCPAAGGHCMISITMDVYGLSIED